MARRCAISGKGVQVGHNVSHANNKTKRRYLPNLQVISLLSDALGAFLTHFTIELVSPESRVERQGERIRELGPVCNLGVGSADCGDCRLASGSGAARWSRVPGPYTPCAARADHTCGERSVRSPTGVPRGSRPSRSSREYPWEELGA